MSKRFADVNGNNSDTTEHNNCHDLRQDQIFPRVQALRGLLLLPNNNMQIKFTKSKYI